MRFNKKSFKNQIFCNNRRIFPHYTPVDDVFYDLVKKFSCNGKAILDFGAGSGFKMDELKNKNNIIFSMDSDFLTLQRNPNSRKVLANGQAFRFKNESFDIITFKYVFEHLKKPQLILGECYKCLKKGGYIIFLCPNKYSYLSFLSRFTPFFLHKLLRKGIAGIDYTETFPVYYKLNSLSKIKRVMKQANFELVEVKSYVGYPTYWEFSLILHMLFCIFHRMIEILPIRKFDISLVGVFKKKDKY